MEPFRDFLGQHLVLFDGGIGTEFYRKGIFINRCYDELNLSDQAMVKEVHEEYIKAGADAIETNTFGANRLKLSKHGLEDKLFEINYRGARIAKEVAGEKAYVAGSIGPLGIRIEPWGKMAREEAREVFKEQAEALLEGGVDLFILETFLELSPLEQAVLAVREICDLPVIAQLTIREDGSTPFGTPVKMYTEEMSSWDADVIGLNCSVGPEAMLEAIEVMAGLTKRPLSAMPNAGKPKEVEGRNIYLSSPDYFAEYARRFATAGTKVIGGCCGTTPKEIHSAKAAIKALKPVEHGRRWKQVATEVAPVQLIPQDEKSGLARKISKQEFVRVVEIVPPRGWDVSKVLKAARALKEAGIDAVNIPDGPRASSRMSSLALAATIEREVGIESVLHYCCRDRNLLGMQSGLLGAYSLGIRNVLIITGDPPKLGDYPDATAVFDVDSIGMVNVVNRLNHGRDIGNDAFGDPTGFFIGVGVNPQAPNLDYEIRRFWYKVDAGAEFAMTQPVFDPGALLDFLPRISHCLIPIIVGIWPLASLRNAEFLRSEVPGVHVPDHVMERMRRAEEKGGAAEEGIKIARECLLHVKDSVQGVQVGSPFGKFERAIEVVSG
ncbi:MAG: bifunctional homocysteine S-methyltransferase/methylenetetrahydrofolate reductase [bacterium]